MKVNGQNPAHLSELTAGKTREKGQKAGLSQSRQSRENEAVTNNTSLTTRRIRETLRNEPDMRMERVARIKDEISKGKYKIDAEKLAENMLLDSLQEDLEKP